MGRGSNKKLITFLLWMDSTDGDDLDWVAEGAAARGQITPTIVKQRPKLSPDAIFYWYAFLDLLDQPWVACNQYAVYYGVSTDLLWRIITTMRAARKKTHGPISN